MRYRTASTRAIAACCSAVLGTAALTGLTLAPVASAATYTNVLTNADFSQPGIGDNAPNAWNEVDLDGENDPYDGTDINAESATSGNYPPPDGTPSASGWADQVYYNIGDGISTNPLPASEGYGGQQTVAGLTNADDPQVGYSTAESSAPGTTAATWAGSVFQVDFTSGPTSYTLRYFNPWTPYQGTTFPDAPSQTSTTKYIVGPTLTSDTWFTQTPRDLNTDILNQFGLTTYTVTDVVFGDLEDSTAEGIRGGQYANMASYFTSLDLASDQPVGPVSETPESPLVVGLPVAGVVAAGGAIWLTRRRRRQHRLAD